MRAAAVMCVCEWVLRDERRMQGRGARRAGGKLVVHYTRKQPSPRICGATGVRLNGVRGAPSVC